MFFFFFSSRRRHTRLTCDWSSDVCSSDLFILRSDGAAFARYLGGDPLRKLAEGTIVEEKGRLGLAEHVNEARSDDSPLGIDFTFRVRIAQIADGGDVVALDGDVGGIPRIACAIQDVTVANDEVVAARGRRRGCFERSIVSGGSDFAEGLPSHFLCSIGISGETHVVHIRRKRELLTTRRDYVAGKSFAVEHHFAIELVFGAERAGFCEDVTGAGTAGLDFGECSVLAENGKRFEEDRIVRTGGPVSKVVGDEIRAEKIGPVSTLAVALRCAGKVELGVLKKSAFDFEAGMNRIGEIFRGQSS